MIKLLIGGSPCTFWSIAKRDGRETTAEGQGWELFKNYLAAKEKFKPDFFLYENNKSAAQAIKDQIKYELGVDNGDAEYIEINSALVSAQNRQRFYVHNCNHVEQPIDRGERLQDILESGMAYQDKSHCLTASYEGAVLWNSLERRQRTMVAYPLSGSASADQNIDYEGSYVVYDSEITVRGKHYSIDLPNGRFKFRKLTPIEAERLQTLPDNYTKCVSKAQRYKCLGNGWTAEVIIHILNGALKDVPRDEELQVLSMYDGIGTGRYCLDKMGFKNVKYYAYEIDKYAKEVSMSNYPDIIQMGDAFQIRNDDWKLGDVS